MHTCFYILPLFMIRQDSMSHKGIDCPIWIRYCNQSKAWMDGPLMLQWVKEIWLKHTGKDKRLLVFDTFKAHITDEVSKPTTIYIIINVIKMS